MRTINWNLIRTLPANAAIVTGGPEYGCFRCAHVPAGRHHVEALFAEIGSGLYRKLLEPRKGQPSKWGQAHPIGGKIEDFTEVRHAYDRLKPTREYCIAWLRGNGYAPANWALTSFDTVELDVLREYVAQAKDRVFEGELDQADFEHQMEDAEVAL